MKNKRRTNPRRNRPTIHIRSKPPTHPNKEQTRSQSRHHTQPRRGRTRHVYQNKTNKPQAPPPETNHNGRPPSSDTQNQMASKTWHTVEFSKNRHTPARPGKPTPEPPPGQPLQPNLSEPPCQIRRSTRSTGTITPARHPDSHPRSTKPRTRTRISPRDRPPSRCPCLPGGAHQY